MPAKKIAETPTSAQPSPEPDSAAVVELVAPGVRRYWVAVGDYVDPGAVVEVAASLAEALIAQGWADDPAAVAKARQVAPEVVTDSDAGAPAESESV